MDFFKNQLQPIFWANLPLDTLGLGQKSIDPDEEKTKTSNLFVKLHYTLFKIIGRALFKMSKCVKQ
jgi:hypothetical protein